MPITMSRVNIVEELGPVLQIAEDWTEDIFRPSAWNSFGMEKESADYKTCPNFGSLY